MVSYRIKSVAKHLLKHSVLIKAEESVCMINLFIYTIFKEVHI